MEQSVSETIDVVIEVIACSIIIGFLTISTFGDRVIPILEGMI